MNEFTYPTEKQKKEWKRLQNYYDLKWRRKNK